MMRQSTMQHHNALYSDMQLPGHVCAELSVWSWELLWSSFQPAIAGMSQVEVAMLAQYHGSRFWHGYTLLAHTCAPVPSARCQCAYNSCCMLSSHAEAHAIQAHAADHKTCSTAQPETPIRSSVCQSLDVKERQTFFQLISQCEQTSVCLVMPLRYTNNQSMQHHASRFIQR
jgi:hypothetical protein